MNKIELGAFYKSNQLKTVEFEDKSILSSIGQYAFFDTAIETIKIPSSVTEIGQNAFPNDDVVHHDAPPK